MAPALPVSITSVLLNRKQPLKVITIIDSLNGKILFILRNLRNYTHHFFFVFRT